MSYFARSSASALTTTPPFRTWAEYDAHVVELGKRNAAALAPFGVKTIDAYAYNPPADATTLFRCTPTLRGRIYPHPANTSLFLLDFIDNFDKRWTQHTGFTIYHAGRYGDGPRIQYDPEGSTQERRAAIDLYILNPELVAEIDNGEIMRRISFIFMGSLNIIPVIGDKMTIVKY